jgi:hypothetical protein
VVEICEDDLRFTAKEAGDFLKQALGLDLDPQIIAALEARTEGWIAGLQLAALSVRGQPAEQIAEFVELFGGSHRHIIDYLADEVLSQQSDEIRDFLCRTSILDRLTAPLCDEVTGRSDSKAILRKLDGANLFLVPLDDQRTWYRYHHLFADFLRTELDAETQALLHSRASRWLVTHGLLSEAVKHALASGDLVQAADVVASASAEAFRFGSLATLQEWLDALPDQVVRGHSGLATYQGFLSFFTRQPTQTGEYADAAERSLPPDAAPPSRGRLLSLKAHLALRADDPDAAVRYSREALACLGPGDAVFRNLTWNLLGQVLELKGDVVAWGTPEEAVTRIFQPTQHYGAFNCGRLTRYVEDFYSLQCCLGTCTEQAIMGAATIRDFAELYSAATGIEVAPDELRKSAERVYNLYKMLNVREGFGRVDDEAFPDVWLMPIDTPDRREALTDYYRMRELTLDPTMWRGSGKPPNWLLVPNTEADGPLDCTTPGKSCTSV